MAIIGRPTMIVSTDHSKGLDPILNDYCSTWGNHCSLKKESELTADNYKGDLMLVGILSAFKKWRLYGTPIVAIPNGFIVNNKKFTDSLDGFVFVDTNRIIISGNSLTAVKNAQLALTGGHDILITQGGKITFYGNRKGNGFDWFNLQNLKTSNYNKLHSALFSGIYISKTFTDTIDITKLNKELTQFAAQFLSIYQIKQPTKKSSWFVHSNMQEYGTMSGMFGFTCPGNNSGGFSVRGEIHTKGYNIPLVKHEYSHYLFDNNIPQDNNPAFFVEGCVEYVTDINDEPKYKERIQIAKRYADTLNFTELIIQNKDFYGQNSDANYSICGVFVKYLIDKYGVTAFKKYCLAANKQVATKQLFGMGFDELVAGYKIWLKMQ